MDILDARKEVLKNLLLLPFGEFSFFFVIVGHNGKDEVVAKRIIVLQEHGDSC